MSVLQEVIPEFRRTWKRAGANHQRRTRAWLREALGLLVPLVEDDYAFYTLTLSVAPGCQDPYRALNQAVAALRRAEPLAECRGVLVRHGGAGARPNLHLLLASPQTLTRDARERARKIARPHSTGLTWFKQLYLRHGAEPKLWDACDLGERRLALEATLLYMAREILELPQDAAGPRRRFERFLGKRVAPPDPPPPEDPWLLLPQVTAVPLPCW